VIVSIGSNFFYTVTLPCTLWFFDKGKRKTDRADSVLFIDARKIFNQIDRAHRDFKPEQIEFLANIVRLHRGEKPELVEGSDELMAESFPDGNYEDVAGLCKVATLSEIEAQGWSLNPGRYVGVEAAANDDFVFGERLASLQNELVDLALQATSLQSQINATLDHLVERAR
jgi:type I restriction enzyme M protein